MDKYRSLVVWQRAHQLVSLVLDATEGQSPPRTWALFDQLRRAAISIEANVVEGYALGTRPQFGRHLRIAFGSAAEAECLTRTIGERGYLSAGVVERLRAVLDGLLAALFGLMRKLRA